MRPSSCSPRLLFRRSEPAERPSSGIMSSSTSAMRAGVNHAGFSDLTRDQFARVHVFAAGRMDFH